VAKGVRGAAIAMSSAQRGLLFQPTTPALFRCNDFKGGSKARCSSSTDSSSVRHSKPKSVTDYHAVALVSSHKVTLILQTRPYRTLRHPWATRSTFASLPAQGGEGGGVRWSTLCWCLLPSARSGLRWTQLSGA